jgi:hypothetical protein
MNVTRYLLFTSSSVELVGLLGRGCYFRTFSNARCFILVLIFACFCCLSSGLHRRGPSKQLRDFLICFCCLSSGLHRRGPSKQLRDFFICFCCLSSGLHRRGPPKQPRDFYICFCCLSSGLHRRGPPKQPRPAGSESRGRGRGSQSHCSAVPRPRSLLLHAPERPRSLLLHAPDTTESFTQRCQFPSRNWAFERIQSPS